MSKDFSRRSVLSGIGSAGLLASVYGTGTVTGNAVERARSSIETAELDGLTSFATTTDPVPTVAAERPILTGSESDPGSQVALSESTETAITVPARDAGSFESGSSIEIWAGTVDTDGEDGPTGVADEELTIEVTRPDDETEEFTEVTDENGSVSLTYDAPDDVVGTYSATVTDSEERTATAHFIVGPVLESTGQGGRSRPVLVGDDATFRFLLLDGQEPITDETVTITVNDTDGDTLNEETVTTGDEGFAEITVEPSETGEYSVQADATVDGVEVSAVQSYPVSEIGYEYDFFSLDDLLAGREAAQGGRVWSGDGPLADTEIELQYSNEDADIEITETATTDANGFFALRFDAPTDVDSLEVSMATTDGRSAALGTFEDTVDVNQPDTDEEEDPEPEVDANFDDFRVAPGETTPLMISATDENEEPIADATVNVAIRYGGFRGDGAPVEFTSIETDADGEATLDITVPENAADNRRLNARLTLEQEEQTLTDDDSITVQSTDTFVSRTFDDGEIDLSLDASDSATGDPIEGYNQYIDIQYISGRTGSAFADRLVSDADGTDSTSAVAPDDLSFMIAFNEISKTDGTGGFSVDTGPYPGQLSSGLDAGEAAEPGTDLPLEYDVEADSVSGLFYGSIGDVPVAATFDTETEDPSIPIPEDVIDDTARIEVWGVGSDGELYSGFSSIDIDPDAEPEPTAEFSVTEFEPDTATLDAGETLSVSATITNVGDASGTGTAEVTLEEDTLKTADLDLDVEETREIDHDIETDDLDPGEEYTYAVETDDDTATGSLQIEDPDPPEDPGEGEHESGVDQELFDAVDRDDSGELNRGDIRNMINEYAENEQVDGVPLDRDDVRKLINFYAQQ